MQVIRGTRDEPPAPRPTRGLTQLLYDAIEDLGTCKESEIAYILPSLTENTDLYVDKSRIHQGLISAKSWGYLVHEPSTDTWRIAPRSYYNARQQYLKDPKREKRRRNITREPRDQRGYRTVEVKVTNWRYVGIAAYLALFVGFALGYWVGASA